MHVFRSELLPPLLQTLRTSIFPNNALAPARPVPTLREQRLIKRRAANAILSLVPAPVAARFFATSLTRVNSVKDAAVKPLSSKPAPSKGEGIQIPDIDLAREMQLCDIERTLDVFGDKYMNKHLLYSIIELVVVRLVPEIAERSVQELIEERIGPLKDKAQD